MPFNFCSAPGRNCYIWTPLCWSPICPLLPLMGHRHPVQAAAEMWAGQVKEMGLTKAWLGGGKANLPVSSAWKAWAATSALLGMPAPQKRAHQGYNILLSCPAAWQPCTQTMIVLDTLLLSQSSPDTPHASLHAPYPQTYPSSPGLPLWCTQNRQSLCLSVSFHNAVSRRAD